MKHLLAIFLLFLSAAVTAQEFDIRSFTPVPNDLSARKEVRRTVNDEPCALIKVVTNIKGMQFESNIGIVDVEHQADGYWLYVAPRERRIKLMASGYLSKDVQMPEPAKELTVYELTVATIGNSIAESDLVRITFRISEADAYIAHGDKAPVMTAGTNAVYDLPRGAQRFTFRKAGFEDKVIDVEVDAPEVIDVALKAGTPSERMKLPGFIIVTSEPSGAEVFLNDQRVGQTPYQGRQLPGSYNLALRNHLYHDHEERFDLAEGGTATLPLVKLKPRFGFVNLTTDPAGAEVYLDGKMVGKSPIDGLQVESGTHRLSIRRTAYHEPTENIEISDGETENLDLALRPAFGTLIITSDPEGAEVFLDEQRAGTTPFRENKQPSGAYNLRLELPMHSTERGQIRIEDELTTERFFALSKNYGTIRIESEDAEIYLGGEKIGTGSFDHRAAPGSYTLTAKKDRHDDDSREVFLTIGQVETITLNPEPRTGVLSIMTEPFEASGAEIWIDGKKTEYKTPAVVELLEGEYEVGIVKDGYGSLTEMITVKADNEESILRKLTSSKEVTISTTPSGVLVSVDGKEKGASPVTANLSFGTHYIELLHEGSVKVDSIVVEFHGQESWMFEFDSQVRLKSMPSRMEVYDGSKKLGITPFTTRMNPGSYSLSFKGENSKTKPLGKLYHTALVEEKPHSTLTFDFRKNLKKQGDKELSDKHYRQAIELYKLYLEGTSGLSNAEISEVERSLKRAKKERNGKYIYLTIMVILVGSFAIS